MFTGRARRSRTLVWGFAAAVLLAAVVLFALKFSPRSVVHRVEDKPAAASQLREAQEQSIAVLPFHAISADKESERLAEGIHDEILSILARNKGLKVISQGSVLDPRLSSMSNAAKGDALGVTNLMEGSLQREAGRFRVNARLLEARSGKTLYARTFESEESDLFGLQSRIAQDVAAYLEPSQTEQASQQVPTKNLAAYELYLRAREWERRPELDLGVNALKAAQCYEQALGLDPNFALAEVRLAYTYARLYWQENDWSLRPSYLAKAQQAVERALHLRPDLPETHAALGYYHYYGHRDYDHALVEFKLAQQDLPNDSEIALAIGLVQRRKARWEDSLSNLQRATALDPLNARYFTILADTYEGLRRYDDAQQTVDRVLALAPSTPDVWVQRAYLNFKKTGRTEELRRVTKSIEPAQESDTAGFARWEVNMFERKYDEAVSDAQKSRLTKFETEWGIFPKELLCGLSYFSKGDLEHAQPFFDQARTFMEPVVQTNTEGPRLRIALALAYAGLARKAEALQQGRVAADERSVAIDAVAGPPIAATLARVYVMVGEKDAAVRELADSVKIPFGISKSRMRFEPLWDPLRAMPEFEGLLK